MRLKKKFLSDPKKKVVTYLADFQQGVSVWTQFVGKRITVYHYHEPFEWNFFIYLIDPEKGFKKKNRIIFYPYNFRKIKK